MKSLAFLRGVAVSVALTLSGAPAALAADLGERTPLNLAGAPAGTHAAASGGSSLVRTVVGLAIVIAVIYGVSWILRQSKAAKTRPLGQGLAQVANLPLGNGRSVSLVRVGDELVLLGIADGNVTRIRSYTEEEALDAGLLPDGADLAEPAVVETPVARAIDTLRRMTARS